MKLMDVGIAVPFVEYLCGNAEGVKCVCGRILSESLTVSMY